MKDNREHLEEMIMALMEETKYLIMCWTSKGPGTLADLKGDPFLADIRNQISGLFAATKDVR